MSLISSYIILSLEIYHIISDQSEAHILLTRGIFWHISCLCIEYSEASILLMRGVIHLGICSNLSRKSFEATARWQQMRNRLPLGAPRWPTVSNIL